MTRTSEEVEEKNNNQVDFEYRSEHEFAIFFPSFFYVLTIVNVQMLTFGMTITNTVHVSLVSQVAAGIGTPLTDGVMLGRQLLKSLRDVARGFSKLTELFGPK